MRVRYRGAGTLRRWLTPARGLVLLLLCVALAGLLQSGSVLPGTRGAVRLANARTSHPAKPVAQRARVAQPPASGSLTPAAGAAGPTGITHTVTVAGRVRTYVVFRPPNPLSAQVPALVVLHGRDEPIPLEERRDGLLGLVEQGRAEVVYPLGYRESWNAGACCGPAQRMGMDDLGFVTRVITRVRQDPLVGSVILAGFSNGGRMVYRAACSRPDLVSAMVVVDAVDTAACPGGRPVSLLQMDGTLDPIVAYDASVPPHVVGGFVEPSAVAQVVAWRHRDTCTNVATTTVSGSLRLQVWASCAAGTTVQFATFAGLGHAWPPGEAGAPSGADLLWAFVTAGTTQPVHPGSTVN